MHLMTLCFIVVSFLSPSTSSDGLFCARCCVQSPPRMKVERQERQTLIRKGKPDKVRELCQQGDLTFVQWQSPGHGDSLVYNQSMLLPQSRSQFPQHVLLSTWRPDWWDDCLIWCSNAHILSCWRARSRQSSIIIQPSFLSSRLTTTRNTLLPLQSNASDFQPQT